MTRTLPRRQFRTPRCCVTRSWRRSRAWCWPAGLRQRDPRASVPELLRRAVARGIVAAELRIDRTTAWRACRRLGLPTRARPSKREGDLRRWRYPHRMQRVLADGKHFRAGATRLRRVALFFIDDATRYGLDVLVGTSESTELFLRGLYEVVLRHGLADLFYLDRGPGFISHDTLAVVQGGLGAWLIHGAARYPQGRGAVERFNRTASERVLRATLRLLSREETRTYLRHRCTLAGAPDDPFDEDAHQSIFEISRGNLHAIDRLALAAVQRAATAGAAAVGAGDVIAARRWLGP